MSLSERVRPNSEAAPWVVDEIKGLEAEVKRMEDVILAACAGERLERMDIVKELVKREGCQIQTVGNPMDGYERDCKHGYEWLCEDCPCGPYAAGRGEEER